ncbi:signal recognition particle protein [Micrococcales bacterium 31B]|nr:signal recognition particle protein [Micrococcales bacterium 31B]
MFASLSDRITASLKNLRGKGRLSESDVDGTIREIRRALLDADVAVPAVREFTSKVREAALGEEVSKALNPGQQVVKIVHAELVTMLGGATGSLNFSKHPPTVIMLAGLQGAGKTTLAGKLARWLKEQGHTPLLVACDLQRPNAVNQLQIVGERAGVPVAAPFAGNGVGDPVEAAEFGIQQGCDNLHSVVIVDTAGRLGIDAEMMQQAIDIRDAVEPDDILFVVDSMIGQDAVNTAEAFRDGVGFTGVVLSKLDGDTRGGAALSIQHVTGAPILFASTGEKLEEFEVFHPDRMASRILDMGDVMSLIEQAERAFDEDEAAELARKMQSNEDFTLDDFLQQMQSIRKMGSLKKMMGMLPGMAQMRDQLANFDEREIDRVEAIVRSMTPAERQNPKIINGSRRSRIAKGCGRSVSEVNQMLERFGQAQQMMRAMKGGGGMPGMPGMPGAPGMGHGKKSRGRMAPPPQSKGKKSKSGNPAKRAAEEREAAAKASARAAAPGAAFGGNQMPDLPPDFDPSQLQGGLGALFGKK